jgi:hypothetical protein
MSANANGQRRVSQLRPMTLDEIEQLPAAQWLIEGYIQQEALVVVVGAPGVGKTFTTLDWALSIATGTPWLGCKTQRGEVVYVYAEGRRGIKRRCNAWLKQRGLEAAPDFRAIPCSVNMLDGADRGYLATAIKDAKLTPRLIVIDTLARNFGGGDENQTKDMNQFVNGCDDLRVEHFPGVTVLVVHHTGKNAKRGARGAIALTGAADAEFLLTGTANGVIKLSNTKQKDGEQLRDLPLRLVSVEESCVIRAAGAAEAARAEEEVRAPRGKNTEDAVFFALLSLGPAGASYTAWQDASGKPKATFDRHRDKLVDAGRVKKWGELYSCVVSLDDLPDAEDGYHDNAPEEANREH